MACPGQVTRGDAHTSAMGPHLEAPGQITTTSAHIEEELGGLDVAWGQNLWVHARGRSSSFDRLGLLLVEAQPVGSQAPKTPRLRDPVGLWVQKVRKCPAPRPASIEGHSIE